MPVQQEVELERVATMAGLRRAGEVARESGGRVGLVPTMGALHRGHAELIDRAVSECDWVVVSIFVNPIQFRAGEDLSGYPRTLDEDLRLAAAHGAAAVFVPDAAEMYPQPFLTRVQVAGLGERWEGVLRPGHFDGVTTVVAKLFAATGSCRSYFGEKDYQQLLIVTRMAAELNLAVEVVPCPTVRHDDGLALSSRNAYLSPDERSAATVLYRALLAGSQAVESGERKPRRVGEVMAGVVGAEPLASLDYAAAVDASTLEEPVRLEGEVRLLIAAKLGKARLIDNLAVQAA